MRTTYPQYHFRPKKNWINDPNGTIYYNGYYHIFYQYNPTSDCWGNLHWGHARTKNFINYEVLQETLYPQNDENEMDCYSGCIAINKKGEPVALYTSVPFDNEETPNIQKAVLLDNKLEHFEKKRVNVITKDMKNLPPIRNDWRDPYIFMVHDRYFLVLGAAIGEKQTPSVLLFESPDGSLTHWNYIKELINFKPVIELFECPNFFRLQDKWILIGSPYKEVEYYMGTFDIDKLDFSIEKSGFIDHCAQFYATNTIQDEKNRTLLVAFERGFSKNQGWNNVISLPRELSLNKDCEFIQRPIEEINTLRRDHILENRTFHLSSIEQIEDERFVQSEINFNVMIENDNGINLILRAGKQGVCQILFSSTGVKFDSIFIPFQKQDSIEVQLYIDHSVLEIFLNGGRQCATRVIEAVKDFSTLEFRGNGRVENLSIYEMGDLTITEEE